MIIDFHSHIIPKLDHGTGSVETSLGQLNLAKKNNVDIIVATSHFYPHMHNAKSFFEKRSLCYDELKKAIEKCDLPKIILGAEVLVCEGINRLPDLELLCIENTRALLLELPFGITVGDTFVKTFKDLIENGYDVVLAHADRYDPNNIEKLVDVGAKIQLNASALSRLSIKKHIKSWINRGIVVAIGSDIHGQDASAYKRFKRAISRLNGNADAIMQSAFGVLTQTNIKNEV
jgi:protein-tyrosine phosphatase